MDSSPLCERSSSARLEAGIPKRVGDDLFRVVQSAVRGKAKTEAKFSDINRGICENEFEQALAYARKAGLWRLDRRWRSVRPRFEFVEVPPAV
jgi:hypothetical protein